MMNENVHLDCTKLQRLRINAGLSVKQLKGRLDTSLSPNTIDKALRGEPVRPDVAKLLTDFFGVQVLQVLAPDDPRYVPPVELANDVPWEWEIDDFLQPGGLRASNGLYFFACRMKHRHTTGRLGRGKFYLLSGMSSTDREQKRQQLQRHPEVCNRIGPHPNLAETESSTPIAGEDGWWVVDRWVDAQPLSEHLASGRCPPERLPRLMLDIALGLNALHEANVVMRELAPSRILISRADSRAVLTDFELAKLLDTAPSGFSDWPDDPYRAPEVESGHVSVQADLYSWAKVLLHAANGKLPSAGKDRDALLKAGLPEKVLAIARDCLSESFRERPQNVAELLKILSQWKE